MYHSRKIGVFISHLFGEYQHNLCQGILAQQKNMVILWRFLHLQMGDPKHPCRRRGDSYNSFLSGFWGIIFANGTYPETDSLMPFISRSHNTAPVRFLSSIRKPMLPIMSFWTTMPPLQIWQSISLPYITLQESAILAAAQNPSLPIHVMYFIKKHLQNITSLPWWECISDLFGMEYAREALTYFLRMVFLMPSCVITTVWLWIWCWLQMRGVFVFLMISPSVAAITASLAENHAYSDYGYFSNLWNWTGSRT